ncbi:hypothetical protein HDV04_005728 [Boothiomyces sp. JEL0838]|nr:hypothetical protein HDV04_005728 [Boothiomyces sp. JEL0838]
MLAGEPKSELHQRNKRKEITEDEDYLENEAEIAEAKPPQKDSPAKIWSYTPFRQVAFLAHLFFAPKFFVHRVTGLIYLLQYAAAFALYFYDYDMFRASPLVWSLPLTGVIQSITAIYTFTFLPKKTKDPGYFSDKYTMNYPFIVENSFFALILLWQWVYYDDFFYEMFKETVVFEWAFVFFPYVMRQAWPQTRFRDSLESTNGKTQKNQFFYQVAIMVTKAFYIWAKHYIGYFLNYARYLNRISPEQTKHIYLMEISSAFATTIAVFLHTLKFRKMIGPRFSFFIYAFAYLSTFYSYYFIFDVFPKNLDLTLLCLGGVAINFASRKWHVLYQVMVFSIIVSSRYNIAPEALKGFLPLPVGNQ